MRNIVTQIQIKLAILVLFVCLLLFPSSLYHHHHDSNEKITTSSTNTIRSLSIPPQQQQPLPSSKQRIFRWLQYRDDSCTFFRIPIPNIFCSLLRQVCPDQIPVVLNDNEVEQPVQTYCPHPNDPPMFFSQDESLPISKSGSLCTLSLVKTSAAKTYDGSKVSDVVVPIARSYDGHDWEVINPKHYNATFVCSDQTKHCSVTFSDSISDNNNERYQLVGFERSYHEITLSDSAARFLEQTTFGPTLESVANLVSSSSSSSFNTIEEEEEDQLKRFQNWMEHQLYHIPPTLHREYFRKRANTRFSSIEDLGAPLHPCASNTRWQTFALNQKDDGSKLKITQSSDNVGYVLWIDGSIRTEVSSEQLVLESGDVLKVGREYKICNKNRQIEDKVGSDIRVMVDKACQKLMGGNPQVRFFSTNPTYPENTILVSSDTLPEFVPLRGVDAYVHIESIESSTCDLLPIGTVPVHLNFVNSGTWFLFDPRINLMENTLDNPIPDGGGSIVQLGPQCSNVPRTFVNQDTCRLSTIPNTCGRKFDAPDTEIPLTIESIVKLQELSENDYVYAISGLRVEKSPCQKNTRSRWELVDISQCTNDIASVDTIQTLVELLNNAEGVFLRDIKFRGKNKDCRKGVTTPTDSNPITISFDSMCWKLVHPDHLSVYDMTRWVTEHPGGPSPIVQFANSKDAFLVFPDWHEMHRWESNKGLFPLLGRLGDSLSFRDLPSNLQLQTVLDEFSDLRHTAFKNSCVLVCGSPGEIENDHGLGETGYNMILANKNDDFTTTYLDKQKDHVWTNVVLKSPDQLRQRMAWALSQILAVNPKDVTARATEVFLAYYDIFVRHAFGNYRDILKEVAYSPVMAHMLSYKRSFSSAYSWERYKQKSFADENFAREIMQLFTIGTVMLNMDGTPILDPITKEPIASYTNDHIMSFARAWTGFDVQSLRSNIETYRLNLIDPMQIIPEFRDLFPKINLSGGYIGDGYPLCVDLPDRFFLRKGAKYRLLGSSTLLELQSNPFHTIDPLTTSLYLSTNSKLYEKLCNAAINGGNECRWQNEVVLDENIDCHDQECEVDTLRLVQVTETIFFEYVDPPCVRLPFYHNAKKIASRLNNEVVCADPRSLAASEACCNPGAEFSTKRNCIYVGERMTYDRAVNRCQAVGQNLCDFNKLRCENSKCCASERKYFWRDQPCKVKVKVDDLGYAALVHQAQGSNMDQVHPYVNRDTVSFFPVYWTENYPSLSNNNCGMGACEIIDGGCLCEAQVNETIVFKSIPDSVGDIISHLHIGSFSPETFDKEFYQAPIVSGEIKVYLYKNASYDMNTIFEIEVKNKIKYFKNVRSVVRIMDSNGNSTDMSFRNPPHFMKFPDVDVRDAQYETEAVLDDYFYHPNTAPFLATFFIQRFGNSNPSPRYVEEVARAFTNGSYQNTFGSGHHGDLGAMIAAIVLDREARSTVLGMDPSVGSLREPLLKLIGFMRSMKYTSFEPFPEISLHQVSGRIGQMAYGIDSVFSFFDQDYAPTGAVLDSSLVAPEGQRYERNTIIGLLNGLYSLSKYGLTGCHNGFGSRGKKCNRVREGDTTSSDGKLSYIPSQQNDAQIVIDELSMLLTAGRLNKKSRNIIKNEYLSAGGGKSGLRLAQQLVGSSPEFHSTNYVEFSGENRKKPVPKKLSKRTSEYKAIVNLFLRGGADSFNILVPHSECKDKDMYEEYLSVRGQIALQQNELLPIGTGGENQVCDKFGIHPDLPVLQSLYDDGDALFFANTGVLTEPVTKKTYKTKKPTKLFNHKIQSFQTQEVDTTPNAITGVLGRMADVLTQDGYNTGSYTVGKEKRTLQGEVHKSPPVYSVQANKVKFNAKPSSDSMESSILEINNAHNLHGSGIFGKTWSDQLHQSLLQTDEINEAIKNVQVPETFPDTNIGRELEIVSTIIQARETLNTDRQFLMATGNGFDNHRNLRDSLSEKLKGVNDSLLSFVDEMKKLGVWKNVILIISSEFGRTMTPNGQDGSDHGWGGNYIILGGGLNGGRILGKYPDNLTLDGPLMLKRGRVIPTTSWDSIYNAVAQWAGISNENDLKSVLPNRENFEDELFDEIDLFDSSTKVRKSFRHKKI